MADKQYTTHDIKNQATTFGSLSTNSKSKAGHKNTFSAGSHIREKRQLSNIKKVVKK